VLADEIEISLLSTSATEHQMALQPIFTLRMLRCGFIMALFCLLFIFPPGVPQLNGVQKYIRIVKLKAGSVHLSLLSDSYRRAPRSIKLVYQGNAFISRRRRKMG
jgi:hypothetical protein